MKYKNKQYLNVLPGYQGYAPTKPFFHTDLRSTLEGVLVNEGPQEKQGMLERVFSDKSKSVKSTVKALFYEITLRENVNTHLLNRIDEDMCKQNTQLLNLNNIRSHYQPELHKYVTKTKTKLQDSVLELEKEKRKEYLECWRDLMFLKKYLFSALRDYWDLSKRRDALAYDLNTFTKNKS